ncbi:hypothetical protein [Actinocorallia aurantiaca]|uniref:Calcium-binding protein n=1 Tax=Actinocorallia aurantiaca TaxID=46204 RepID=A0ABN3U5R4_9ACTN
MHRLLGLSALLLVPLTAAPAQAAGADVVFTYDKKVVVQGPGTCVPANIRAAATAPSGSTFRAKLYDSRGRGGWISSKLSAGEDAYELGTGCFTEEDTGKWRLQVIVTGRGGRTIADESFFWWQKHDTKFTGFNAGPEPVRKGRKLTVSSRLVRWSDRPERYIPYSARKVRLYFRAQGTSKWTYKATVTTGRDGRFTRAFTADRDGSWQARFDGTSRFDAQTSGSDHVDVRPAS